MGHALAHVLLHNFLLGFLLYYVLDALALDPALLQSTNHYSHPRGLYVHHLSHGYDLSSLLQQ